MRCTPLLIALSLAANAALAAVLWHRSISDHLVVETGLDTAKGQTTGTTPDSFAGIRSLLEQNPDDTAVIAHLKSSGFPPDIVRAVMAERVRERYRPRLRALADRSAKPPHGYSSPFDLDREVTNRAERRAIEREIEDELHSLLGSDDAFLSSYGRWYRESTYGKIRSGKIAELEAIKRDYQEISIQVRENAKGILLREDREKLAYLEKEERIDIEASLSPEELDEYDRRNSRSATKVRTMVAYYDVTEAEYLQLYRAQRDFDARQGEGQPSGKHASHRAAALLGLTEQFKAILGPERFAEFEIFADETYLGTRSAVTSFNLPTDTARELVALQRATTQRARAIRENRSLTPDQQTDQLDALAKEATAKATATVGAENITYFKRTAGGWLDQLTPQSTPAR